MENQYEESVIDLREIFQAFRQHIAVICILTILAGILGFCVTKFAMTPQYEASVDLIVNTQKDQTMDTGSYVSNDTVNSAKNLVATYAIIVKSDAVLEDVIHNQNLDYTVDELSDMVNVESIDDTMVMEVAVTTDNLNLSTRIASEISRVAPQVIVNTVNAGSCNVIGSVSRLEDPVSPSIKKNTAFAAFVGLILGVAYALIKEFFNQRIKHDTDINKYLELPILGVIPEIEEGK